MEKKSSMVTICTAAVAAEVAAFGCYLDDGRGVRLIDELAGFGARTRPLSDTHPLAAQLGYGALSAVQDGAAGDDL